MFVHGGHDCTVVQLLQFDKDGSFSFVAEPFYTLSKVILRHDDILKDAVGLVAASLEFVWPGNGR